MADGETSRVRSQEKDKLTQHSLPDDPRSLSSWLDSEKLHGQFDAKSAYPFRLYPFSVEEEEYDRMLFRQNGLRHRRAAPLVQVFSVRISTNLNESRPSEVYGTIFVTEESKDDKIVVYKRGRDDPQIIQKNGEHLSLSGPDGGPISRSMGATLHLNLRDRTTGLVVIQNQIILQAMSSVLDTEAYYNKLQSTIIEGENGCATVYYATFLHAVAATVKLNLINEHHSLTSTPDDVFVEIVARYANPEFFTSSNDEANYFRTSLLKVPLGAFLCSKPANWVRQCVVVVPVYTALIIEATIWNSQGVLFSNAVDFVAEDFALHFKLVGPRACLFGSEIRWNYVYNRMSVDRSIWGSHLPAGYKPGTRGYNLVEVFSISVGSFSNEIRALCGSILYGDGPEEYHLFQRDENNSLLLQGEDDIVPFDRRKKELSFGCDFRMHLDLNDPLQQLEVSRGYLEWHSGLVNSAITWFDRRICSIIKGNDGYAAIHYSIFKWAVQAAVEVKVSLNDAGCSSDLSFNLHGSLISRYRAYEYSTWYEKKYYKSTLFSKPENDPLEVGNGSMILLSKCAVAVPSNSSLIIEADLGIQCDKFSCIPHGEVSGELEFCCNDFTKTERKEIYGDHYHVEVSVKWK